jgi:UDP-N-acetyl-D-glucosamine/UDP-N-acetyl-D-galactosamine dehydrogenase
VFIVTVPTPVDNANRPDMTPLVRASETVGKVLKRGDVVIYESTVYPGATEEVCVPVLERTAACASTPTSSAATAPSASTPATRNTACPHQKGHQRQHPRGRRPRSTRSMPQIITAGTHKASSIRVAEAAKVIENTQRDLNIALMNELSLIFHKLGIDTHEVLQAAGTKWNFLPFRPGLVGGHCIGVDPYYLTHKAQQVGYHPEVILAGRRINDGMGAHVADETIKLMLRKGIPVLGARVLVLGLTFKENCPDVRNTKVVDIIDTLRNYHVQVDVYDPWIDVSEARHEYGLDCLPQPPEPGKYSAVILAVGHRQFAEAGEHAIKAWGRPGAVLFDVKGILPYGAADARL